MINGDVAYLFGALRDGTFTINKKEHIYRIRIYQKNKEWIERVSGIIYGAFGKQPRIELDKRTGVWCFILNSHKIFDEIVRISEYPGNQSEWKTPSKVLASDNEIKKPYTKGFFDSEGGVCRIELKDFKPKDIRIYFCQVNKQSLEELKDMLNQLGIKTGGVCGPYFKKGFPKPTYGLMIHGIKQVNNFFKTVGSLHPEKIRRFELIEKLDST